MRCPGFDSQLGRRLVIRWCRNPEELAELEMQLGSLLWRPMDFVMLQGH